jgi:hypothetical protein
MRNVSESKICLFISFLKIHMPREIKFAQDGLPFGNKGSRRGEGAESPYGVHGCNF